MAGSRWMEVKNEEEEREGREEGRMQETEGIIPKERQWGRQDGGK